MNSYPAPRKAKRSAVEIEEERAWVRFYRQVGNADIAAEVLAQFDAEPSRADEFLTQTLKSALALVMPGVPIAISVLLSRAVGCFHRRA